MPITDNTFTDAELDAALTATPTLAEAIKTALNKREYSLMSKDEKAAYDSDMEQRVNIRHEASIKELTGIDKAKADEPSSEYQKRVFNSLKQERDALKGEVASFKGKSDLSKVEREQLEDLKDKVKGYDKTIKDLTESSTKEVSKARLENKMIQKVNTVTPKLIKDTRAGIAKAQEILSTSIFAEMQDMAQEDSRGHIILIKADGKAITNEDGSFKTVEQFYEEKMKEAGFIDDGKKQKGAGGNSDEPLSSNIPGGCKTQTELVEWLRNNTMKGKDQKELLKEFDKYAHLLPR